jgi:hypothetical protein
MPHDGDTPNKPQLVVSDSGSTGSQRPNDTSGTSGSESPGGSPVSAIEKNLMQVAEELGTWLGTAERKTTDFLAQKKTITDHLVKIRDTAARLLAQVEKGRERSR